MSDYKIPFPTFQFGDCPKCGKELTAWKSESDGKIASIDGSLYCSGCNKLPSSCDCKT